MPVPRVSVVGGPAWEAKRAMAEELWPSWRELADLEEVAAHHFGPGLAELLLVLWAISRAGAGSDEGSWMLDELISDDLSPGFGGPLISDMLSMAFALGTGWGLRHSAGFDGLGRCR